jgi:drug/metabolite transporter (DMT)-like permease
MDPMKRLPWRNALLLLLAATIWGTAFVAQSVAMDHLSPFTFNAARSLVGGIFLVPVTLLLRRGQGAQQVDEKQTWLGGICCGVVLFVASCLQQFGISYTTVGKAGFLTALYIILVPLLSIFLGKRPGVLLWASVALALVGLYLLCMTTALTLTFGDSLVFLCAVAFSFHILVIDHFAPKAHGVQMSCIQFFTCGVLSLLCALLFETPQVDTLLAAWGPILYAGILSSGVAYTLQIVGQKGMDPTVASLILSLESVISALSGWLILGQGMTGRELSGCVLMFSAIILAQLPKKSPRRPS